MGDAYAFASKSSLKLKSAPGVQEVAIKRKKKKKDKSKGNEMEKALRVLSGEKAPEHVKDSRIQIHQTYRGTSEGGEAGGSETAYKEDKDLFKGKTPVEVAWLKKKREKEMDKIKKKAEVSHQQKVMKFNEGLNKLSEHYDIPKVSWTK